MAYVFDETDDFATAVNPDSVIWQRLSSEHYEAQLKDLVRQHAEATGSDFSRALLTEWEHQRGRFWQVIPKEMIGRLEVPVSEAAE